MRYSCCGYICNGRSFVGEHMYSLSAILSCVFYILDSFLNKELYIDSIVKRTPHLFCLEYEALHVIHILNHLFTYKVNNCYEITHNQHILCLAKIFMHHVYFLGIFRYF